MSTTTPNLNLIQPSKSEKGGWTTYITNNAAIDTAYGEYLSDREQSLENIAPIEGATASKNYTIGSYLVKDGGLYKVTNAIASGESIVVGTNVVATSLNDAVVELNTAVATLQDSLTVSEYTGMSRDTTNTKNTGNTWIRAFKYGQMVCVDASAEMNIALAAWNNAVLFTGLPNAVRGFGSFAAVDNKGVFESITYANEAGTMILSARGHAFASGDVIKIRFFYVAQ